MDCEAIFIDRATPVACLLCAPSLSHTHTRDAEKVVLDSCHPHTGFPHDVMHIIISNGAAAMLDAKQSPSNPMLYHVHTSITVTCRARRVQTACIHAYKSNEASARDTVTIQSDRHKTLVFLHPSVVSETLRSISPLSHNKCRRVTR